MDTHSTCTAPDLTITAPRRMDATLNGYVWLPRMIDKARAARAGTLGGYLYPCPIDRTCLAGLGLDAETFADIASDLTDDDAILFGLRRRGIPSPAASWFDPVALEERLQRGDHA